MPQMKYCPSCGKANHYIDGVAPPKCSGCNKPLSAQFKKAVTAEERPLKKKVQASYEDGDESNEDYYFETPQITRFEANVVVAKRLNLRDISQGQSPESFGDGSIPN